MTDRRTNQGWLFTALLVFFTGTAVMLVGVLVQAAFYRYTNETGKQVFVDDPGQIPEEFRDGAEVYTEMTDDMSEEELQRHHSQEKKRQATEERRQREKDALEEKARREKAQLTTPIRIENNLIFVPVTLSHKGTRVTSEFLFDTGASAVVLSKRVARNLALLSDGNGKVKGIGGSVQAARGVVDVVKVGPFRMKEVSVVVVGGKMPLPGMQGILGMSFLRNHTYRIDIKRKVILWDPIKK